MSGSLENGELEKMKDELAGQVYDSEEPHGSEQSGETNNAGETGSANDGNKETSNTEDSNHREEAPHISITIVRSGFLIEIEGRGVSITFYPYDKDKTFDAIILKCKDLGQDLISDLQNTEVQTERHNIEIQLTEIYKEYYEEIANRTIKDEDQLLIIANSLIEH
jgi:hypothetical protein